MPSISVSQVGNYQIVKLSGRFDAHAASEAAPVLQKLAPQGEVLLDFTEVSYLSSAGVRLLVSLQKTLQSRKSRLLLAGLQEYCLEVLHISGLDQFFAVYSSLPAAMADIRGAAALVQDPCGRFVFRSGSAQAGGVEVLGHIGNVLNARITPELVHRKLFSSKAYSIGLGGMAPTVEEVMPLMGEMITIGGTMVWLPTDGNDTPDFLVPRQDSHRVVIQTGYNVSLAGPFNEYVEFHAASDAGATIGEIYEALFKAARDRRPDYRGALGLAMRAEVGEVYGCGVVRAPIAGQAPENGLPITDPANYAHWFEVDTAPRHRDVTGLFCGIGVDLTADLGSYNRDHLDATFYVNPGNKPATGFRLHNHGVFFDPLPFDKSAALEDEIERVVQAGNFIDMRHIFDKTTIRAALIGLIYIQDFWPDSGIDAAPPDAP